MDVLNIKLEPRSNLSISNDDNLSSYSPVSTSSHNLNITNNITNNNNNGNNALDYYNDASLLVNSHLNSTTTALTSPYNSNNTTSNTTNKIRKRSANQAYEYLTTLADSKTFQEWLVNNETDFTWVHKRNSMTNAGKKYYYICNYRIKKGFVRCPAVIYALFPNNEENTVMVYSCGDHVHRRLGSGSCINNNSNSNNTNTNESTSLLNNNPSSMLGYGGYDEHNMTINDDDNEIENDSNNNMNNNTTTTTINNVSTTSSSSLHHQKLRKTISYNDFNNNKLSNVNSQKNQQQPHHHQHQLQHQSHHLIHQNEINNEFNDEDNDDDMQESLFHQQLTLQQQQHQQQQQQQIHYQSSSSSSHKQQKQQQNHSNETLPSNTNNNALSTSSSASSSPSSSITSTSIIQQQLQNQQISNSTRIHTRKRSISSIDPKMNDQNNNDNNTNNTSNNNNNNGLDNNSAASINSYINSIHSKQKSKSRKDLLSKDSTNATNSVAATAAITNSLLSQPTTSSLSNLHNQFSGHHTNSTNNLDIEMKLCKNGMPRAAALTMDNAPVHIDVGGCLYTSSLETLSRHPESKLSKMFNGTIPIVLDTLKQHYFIDRDGKLFRHILNFMRTNRLVLPENFDEFDSLIDEARYFELEQLVKQIDHLIHKRKKQSACDCISNCSCSTNSNSSLLSRSQLRAKQTQSIIRSAFQSYNSNNNNNNNLSNDINCSCSNDVLMNQNESRPDNNMLNGSTNNRSLVQILNNGMTSNNKNQHHHHRHHHGHNCQYADSPCSETNEHEKGSCKILILNHTENSLYISGESALIKSLLPELDEDNYSNNILLNSCKYATKFCLDGSINVHYIEMMERLYDNQFVMEACYGGGLEGQQFNEYIFVKCKTS